MTLATDSDIAIRSAIDSVYSAWNANDADAFVAAYADRASATLPGTRLDSRAAIHATMTAAFAGPLKGSHICSELREVRRVGAESAIATGKSAYVLAGETQPAADHVALTTWVLSARDGTWQIEAYHECPAGGL